MRLIWQVGAFGVHRARGTCGHYTVAGGAGRPWYALLDGVHIGGQFKNYQQARRCCQAKENEHGTSG